MSHLVRKLKGKIVLLCDTNMRFGTNDPHILLIEIQVGANILIFSSELCDCECVYGNRYLSVLVMFFQCLSCCMSGN